MKRRARVSDDAQYDVCLSFAGENRAYVERVAELLVAKGIRVFYDRYERVELWGKDLYSHLDYVYGHAARYCVVFISKPYASKLWTNHERKSAQARAFAENREYILPARFDGTQIPGLPATVGYVDLRGLSPKKIAGLICQKLGPRQRANFLPPILDRLEGQLGVRKEADKERVGLIVASFFKAFKRMTLEERTVISQAFLNGCTAELPSNIHINLDLLRRISGFPVAKLKALTSGLRSLGFSSRQRRGDHDVVEIVFSPLTDAVEPREDETGVVVEMMHCAGEDLCDDCAMEALLRADFSQLASATTEKETRHRRSAAKLATSV